MPAGGTSAAGAGNGGSGGGSGSATGATAGTGAGGGGAAAVGGAGGSGGAAGGAVVDPGPEGDGEVEVGPSYPNGPVEDLRDRGSAKGRSFRFQVESQDSKFYQGDDATLNTKRAFSRRIDVYVPVQYKAGKPAPLLVIHDGPGQLGLVSRALDNLTISTDPQRRLPAFVAIAVANGGGDSKGSQRGLEYDTMSDRFVRFINEEVLPAVENNAEIKQAYPGFKLTTDPEGRATMGCSSGGAAALTMGWFRPDLFHRLITYSGTFVDQQDDDAAEEKTYPLGAWEYHSGMKLIQNADKKPLRIFLHHSDADNGANAPESGHHNWVMANQRTAAALKEKGYHYRHLTAKSAGHCDGDVFNATLADTLVWAWRGYPTD
ncbi:MAG: enterobactin esterase [Myxococcales bacterium]|nr:MAG: enterobactin esterase [Myxococcales bacterium]